MIKWGSEQHVSAQVNIKKPSPGREKRQLCICLVAVEQNGDICKWFILLFYSRLAGFWKVASCLRMYRKEGIDVVFLPELCILISGQHDHNVSHLSEPTLQPPNLILSEKASVQLLLFVPTSLTQAGAVCLSLHLCLRDQSWKDDRQEAAFPGDTERTRGSCVCHRSVSFHRSNLKPRLCSNRSNNCQTATTEICIFIQYSQQINQEELGWEDDPWTLQGTFVSSAAYSSVISHVVSHLLNTPSAATQLLMSTGETTCSGPVPANPNDSVLLWV